MFSPIGSKELAELAKDDWDVPLAVRLGLTPTRAGSGHAAAAAAAAGPPPPPPALSRQSSLPAGAQDMFAVRDQCLSASFVLKPKQFDVVMVVDNREKGHKNDKGVIQVIRNTKK